MTPFAERANTRLTSIKSDHAAAVTAFESLVAAFAEDPKKSNAEDFFGVFVDLIRSLEHACEANDRAAAVAARSGGGAGGGAGAGADAGVLCPKKEEKGVPKTGKCWWLAAGCGCHNSPPTATARVACRPHRPPATATGHSPQPTARLGPSSALGPGHSCLVVAARGSRQGCANG